MFVSWFSWVLVATDSCTDSVNHFCLETTKLSLGLQSSKALSLSMAIENLKNANIIIKQSICTRFQNEEKRC